MGEKNQINSIQHFIGKKVTNIWGCVDFIPVMWYNKHDTKVEKRDRFSYYVFIEPVWSKPIYGLHLWYNKYGVWFYEVFIGISNGEKM